MYNLPGPKGCKLYPIISDEYLMQPVKDKLCPYARARGTTLKANSLQDDESVSFHQLLA